MKEGRGCATPTFLEEGGEPEGGGALPEQDPLELETP
jgi:hypothetical protein